MTKEQLDALNAELERIAGEIKAWAKQQGGKISEQAARLQAVEQVVGALETDGLPVDMLGPGVGAQAMEAFQEDHAFAHIARWNQGSARAMLDLSIKAALTTDGMGTSSDGSIPRQPERRGFVAEVLRPLTLLDVLPSRPTSQDSVEFIRLNATGDAAEQEEEGAEKAEIEFDGEPARVDIATIAAHTTVSKQALSDHAALQAAIDRVMRHKARSRLEHQLINGPGGQGRIDGLLNQATAFVPTVGTTPVDIIGESLSTQNNYGYSPSAILLNWLDWFGITTTKSATEGLYIFGSPLMPIAASLWNVPIVLTSSMPAGEAITLDAAWITVLDRMQASVSISTSHKDYFTRNLVLILAELRAALEVTDHSAIYHFDLGSS